MLQEVARRAGESRIIDAGHLGMRLQPLGNGLSVLLLAIKAELKGLEPAEKEKRVERAESITLSVLQE